MRGPAACLLLGTIQLAGCAAYVPQYDIPRAEGAPTVRSIVEHVRCELGELAAEPGSLLVLDDVAVAVQLNLDVNDTGQLAPTFSYMSGPFMFGAGATLAQSREQSFNAMLHFSMREVASEFADAGAFDRCGPGFTNLEGRLGIKENVDLAGTANNLDTSVKASGTNGVFGGFVTFVVTKSLNGVGPTWALKHFTGPGRFASLSEVNTDKVIFGFAFPNKGEPRARASARADAFIQNVNLNHLSTQLGAIRDALQ